MILKFFTLDFQTFCNQSEYSWQKQTKQNLENLSYYCPNNLRHSDLHHLNWLLAFLIYFDSYVVCISSINWVFSNLKSQILCNICLFVFSNSHTSFNWENFSLLINKKFIFSFQSKQKKLRNIRDLKFENSQLIDEIHTTYLSENSFRKDEQNSKLNDKYSGSLIQDS